MMQITLLRHGRPAYPLRGWGTGRQMIEVGQGYDAAEIADTPPQATQCLLENKPFVVCSDLPRSLSSAAALGVERIELIDPLFRECAMPYFPIGGIKLPVIAWVFMQRVAWLCGYATDCESFNQARLRAEQATHCLAALAKEHRHVLLVGHGMLNHFIAKQLLRLGWQGPKRSGRKHWQYADYHVAV